MSTHSQERRRYFRVTDLVGLSYRLMGEGETDLALAQQPSSLSELLHQLEAQIQTKLEPMRSVAPELRDVLELFNQKLNLALGHRQEDPTEPREGMRACHVNLSACGIAFPADEPMVANQHLAMDMTLYPSNLNVRLIAAVIDCERAEAGEAADYLIRADYVQVSESDREVLVQHVIRRQTKELKDQRLAQERRSPSE